MNAIGGGCPCVGFRLIRAELTDGTAHASLLFMFESIRLPGFRNRLRNSPVPQFDLAEMARSGHRFTAGVATAAVVAAVTLVVTNGSTPAGAPTRASAPAALQNPSTSAVARYEAECGRGSAEACNALGVLFQSGHQVPADPFTAVAFFESACAGGHAEACSNLGAMHEAGNGVPHDLGAARHWYDRACNAGSGLGCSNLGALFHSGRGVQADAKQAALLFEQACAAGSEVGCANLEAPASNR